ncbi:MAG: hypothetical protein C4527_22195 [Candidatus Omnitrophota bacterium]|jgi:hypothetical protein|nr:MAG: hypothetical protein C4527_22195 [Candidatus Omnitrophota bacterium]
MAATMKDIEEEMDEIRMLMKIWNKFYQILTTVFSGEKTEIKKLDPEFQQIKQIVAEHHAHFMKVIKKDFHIGQSILTTVKRTISLEGFGNLSPLEINKTLIEWHDANILLNETLGSLESERDKIIRHRQTKIPGKSGSERMGDFFSGGTFKLVVNLVVILAIVGALVMYWDAISQSYYYRNYFAGFIDPILKMIGIETGSEK